MARHNKQQETAQKQDISEDLQEFPGPKVRGQKLDLPGLFWEF
jgi:hypothetical protein